MQFFDLEAIFCISGDDEKNAIVLTTPMSPTHLSPEPGIPSLPPLPPVDANNPESAPVPLLPAPAVGGPSNNGQPTADAFLSPPTTTTHPIDDESYGEMGTGASDMDFDTLEDAMDDGGSDREASRSSESSDGSACKPRAEFLAAQPEF